MNTWVVPGYTESHELGSGASGRVVSAVHGDTGVPVAVKYLSESLRERPGFVHEFRAEARLLGGLESLHVTGFYEYVESPHGAAIVMELVDGVSLRTLLKRQGPLEPEAALVLLKGSLLGLADAHGIGVVHRDYKPENVLVASDGSSKLVDFGIAVDAGTSAGVAGTPSYMAPEQWTGEPASCATDVYAATATFFECLTGHKPYAGENLAELALQHVDAPIPVDEVPESVRELVRRGLAKEPDDRPSRADAFVTELETAALTAYGPDWEERGRARLAALVALLAMLLPSARAPRTTTDTARTILSQKPHLGGARSWLPGRPGMLVSGSAVLLGVLLTYGIHAAPGAAAQRSAQALATTSAHTGAASPGATAPSTSPSPSDDASPSPTLSPSASASTGTPDPTASTTSAPTSDTTTGATTAPATPTASSPTSPAAAAVKNVAVSALQQTGPSTATATVDITTDGTGPLTLTVSWFTGNLAGPLGSPDGASQTFERSGATHYTLTVQHTFQNAGCYWAVQATTTPAAASGSSSQQILTRQCELR
ncbi:protein kinase domain-containing protein [Streptomyces sp. NPDC001102]